VTVAEYRDRITSVDEQLVSLVNERIAAVEELRSYKAENGIAFLDPDREAALRAHLQRFNEGPLSAEGLDELVTFVLELVKREVARG
jgi:chorismate mutase